ncbi:MAG: B12-binding domain-containing radical SAM protein [Myxococcota bacterium]
MNILLVHARFPVTYWGFQNSLWIVGKKASLPPLGLLTLAALLPDRWTLRLVDLNVRALDDGDLRWADAVLVGGMLVQADSMREVCRRARALGRRTVVGGPAPSTCPELFEEADVVFRGEAEGRVDELVATVESGGPERRVLDAPAGVYPDVTTVPAPRYDLVDLSSYASVSLQYSRGCPYHCEFCDVIEIFGRRPRVKTPEQVLTELANLHAQGYRGSVFFVDDNFIGNRPAVRELLPVVARWQRERGYPFELYTEASVNLAADDDLVGAMVEAGFSSVFLGIETPSMETLAQANKHQNLKLDLHEAVDRLSRSGLEVMGGFIVGFDGDGPEALEAQRRFIESSPIPLSMVGVLTALPGTALWKRLQAEGRLREQSSGDQFGRPNFEPVMDEEDLLRGYAGLMRAIYSPAAYYRRCELHIERAAPRPSSAGRSRSEIAALLRTLWHVGVRSPRRLPFWRLLYKSLRGGTQSIRWAIAHAVQGEHLIRYTEEQVVPRIEAAARSVARDRAQGRPRTTTPESSVEELSAPPTAQATPSPSTVTA